MNTLSIKKSFSTLNRVRSVSETRVIASDSAVRSPAEEREGEENNLLLLFICALHFAGSGVARGGDEASYRR